MSAGYSGTPLIRKLGIKPGFYIHLIEEPDHFIDMISPLPEKCQILKHPEAGSVDYVHMFVTKQPDFDQYIKSAIPLIKKNGMVWVSWPKGSSSIITELNREKVRETLLRTDLVDVKVCAINDDWSGLKFVYRKDKR